MNRSKVHSSSPASPIPRDRLSQLRAERTWQYKTAVVILLPLAAWWVWRSLHKVPVLNSGSDRERVVESAETQGLPIDPNVAPWWELTVLPQVGETTAKRIVAFREARGVNGQPVFHCARDLEAVEGIGPRTVEQISAYLSLPLECEP